MSLAATCYVVVVVLSLISFLQAKGRRNKSCISEFMLRSLPLVNTSSQLENSVRYHFQVVFTSGKLGNFKASPFVPLGVLDLVRSLFGPKYAENFL